MVTKCLVFLSVILVARGHPSLFEDLFSKAADLAKTTDDKFDDFKDEWKDDAEEKLKGLKDGVGGFKNLIGDRFSDVRRKLDGKLAGISSTIGDFQDHSLRNLGDVSETLTSKAKGAKSAIDGIIADVGNRQPDGPLAEVPEVTEEPEEDLEARSARKNRLRAERVIDNTEYLPPWNPSVSPNENSPVGALWLQFALINVTNSLLRDLDLPNWAAMFRALGPEKEILKRYAAISNRFELLEEQSTEAFGIFKNIANFLPNSTWENLWEDIDDDIQSIFVLFGWFQKYQNNLSLVNERTLMDYAESVQGDERTSLPAMLEALHSSALGKCEDKKVTKQVENVPGETSLTSKTLTKEIEDLLEGFEDQIVEAMKTVDDEAQSETTARVETVASVNCGQGAFDVLKDFLTNKVYEGELCTLTKSPQQLVYDLYNLLALTDAKGYAMMQFSWMVLRLYDKGSFAREADLARADFERRVVEKAEVARKVISQLPNWYETCITSKQVENETYIQFTEFLQGYVVNEADLNRENTCKEECKSYKVAEEKGCYKKTFCNSEKRCESGKLYSCTFFEADSSICLSSEKHRRYDWIEYKSGRVVGTKSDCKNGKTAKADSWWRFLYHCSNCLCLCDQPGPRSDRYISLKPSVANVLAGNIVTGVRFVKRGRVVHIQIQEGRALPRGAVNATSLNWRPVEPIIPNDDPTALVNKYSDYATLSWQERSLDLDHLNAPEGHVIIGLRFRRLGGHINLEMQVAPIQFSTGWVDYASAIWVGNDNTPASEKPRKVISLINADTPLRFTSRPLQDSGDNQYIEFQASSIEKDVGQTTIPFLDAQPVAPQPPMWLTGVALVHKGSPGYGGFISLKVATYDLTNHILAPTVQQATEVIHQNQTENLV